MKNIFAKFKGNKWIQRQNEKKKKKSLAVPCLQTSNTRNLFTSIERYLFAVINNAVITMIYYIYLIVFDLGFYNYCLHYSGSPCIFYASLSVWGKLQMPQHEDNVHCAHVVRLLFWFLPLYWLFIITFISIVSNILLNYLNTTTLLTKFA